MRSALLLTSLSTPVLYLGLRWIGRWTGDSSWLNDAALTNAAGHLGALPLMLVGFLRYALLGVVAGPWATRMPGADTISWGLMAAAALVVGAALARADAAGRRAILGMLLVSVAVYGAIALGRASFTGLRGGPAAMATVQRYHYAGSAALTICLATALAALARGRAAVWLGAAMGGLVLVDAWGLYRHPVAIDPRAGVRRFVAGQLARLDAAVAEARPGSTVYLQNQPLPGGVAGVFAQQLVPGTAALGLMVSGSDRWQGRELRLWDADAATREAFRPPTSRWLSRMLVAPHVHLEEPRATCELRAAKQALTLVHRLLRCERAGVTGRVDVATCQGAAQAAYDLEAETCGACLDPRALGKRLRGRLEAARWWLQCRPGPDAPRPPARCSDASLTAAQRLIDGLFACHRRSIFRDHALDDAPCEDRVTRAYRARLASLQGDCGQCFGDALGPAVRWQVGLVFADVFCGSLGPPLPDAATRRAPP